MFLFAFPAAYRHILPYDKPGLHLGVVILCDFWVTQHLKKIVECCITGEVQPELDNDTLRPFTHLC